MVSAMLLALSKLIKILLKEKGSIFFDYPI